MQLESGNPGDRMVQIYTAVVGSEGVLKDHLKWDVHEEATWEHSILKPK